MTITVLMVSGSWPPQACGVGDYAERLSCELEQNGIAIDRYADGKLSRLIAPLAISEINKTDCDLVHIQYPTAGYGRSLTPSVLAAGVRDKPIIVTLHEYSLFRWYRRPWFSPFARYCAARIFTTDEERKLFQRRFPSRGGIDLTIEIASNIPVAVNAMRRPGHVCYFGLIAPNKGIEAFLDLCEAARAISSDLTFELIGAIPEHQCHYAEAILERASSCNARLSLNLSNDAVAKRLAASTFAYLPYPDGASAKRGALAAAIVNGITVVTRHSRLTPDWIRSATLHAETPREALDVIVRLQNDSRLRLDAAKRSDHAAKRFRWDVIAQRHVILYRNLLNISTDTAYESRLAS